MSQKTEIETILSYINESGSNEDTNNEFSKSTLNSNQQFKH